MTNVRAGYGRSVACLWFLVVLTAGALCVPRLRAQAPARRTPAHPGALHKPATPPGAEQPRFKGIFEPVNYNQDLRLTDVFFVTTEEGWVSGYSGTILHTRDGGKIWQAQLGGDPQSQEREIRMLHFVDRTHGWALQPGSPGKLLRTTNGQDWEQAGNVPEATIEYQFVSPTVGILLEGNANFSRIYRTIDGGRTWKETFPQQACQFNAEIQGLARQVGCVLTTLAAASRTVAYAVGNAGPDSPYIIVAKTEDGGVTWSLAVNQAPSKMWDYYGRGWQRMLFFDQQNGLLATGGDRLYATTDGAANWHGVAGGAGELRFADPEVGWAFKDLNNAATDVLRYTSDGGKRWLSRTLNFPAGLLAFSLPRRDRAYVVGDHGMIYRYRVVPVSYQAAAHSIDAPVMPGIDSPVLGEVATLNDVVAKLREKLPTLSQAGSQASVPPTGAPSTPVSGQTSALQQNTFASGGTGASPFPGSTGVAGAAGAGGLQQDTGTGPVAGGYMDSCCGPLMQQLETTANSFAMNVPAYSQRFRNLNLILEGLNLVNSIVNQANTLKQSVRALRRAPNQQAAALALTNVQSQLNGISSSGGFVQDTSLPPQQ